MTYVLARLSLLLDVEENVRLLLLYSLFLPMLYFCRSLFLYVGHTCTTHTC